jgi:hypothetical protein
MSISYITINTDQDIGGQGGEEYLAKIKTDGKNMQ